MLFSWDINYTDIMGYLEKDSARLQSIPLRKQLILGDQQILRVDDFRLAHIFETKSW